MYRTMMAVVAVLAIGLPARAAVITQDLTTGIYDPRGGSGSVEFREFDPTLGTLTGVDISVAKSLRLIGSIGNFPTNGAPSPTGSGVYGFSDFAQISIDGLSPFAYPGAVPNFTGGSVGNGVTFFAPPYPVTPFDLSTVSVFSSALPLAPFSGSGTGTIGFVDQVRERISPPQPTTGVALTSFLTENVVTLTYTYTENQVPEPLSLGLLGLGVIAAGMARRRSS